MAIDTSDRAACADCEKPIYRTAPGTGYDWAHVKASDLMACKSTGMTRPALRDNEPCLSCGDPTPPGKLLCPGCAKDAR